jgi:hypothetical protein
LVRILVRGMDSSQHPPPPPVPILEVQSKKTENLLLSHVTHKAVFEQLKWIKSVTFKFQVCVDFVQMCLLQWYSKNEYKYEMLIHDEQSTGTVTTTVHQFYS